MVSHKNNINILNKESRIIWEEENVNGLYFDVGNIWKWKREKIERKMSEFTSELQIESNNINLLDIKYQKLLSHVYRETFT